MCQYDVSLNIKMNSGGLHLAIDFWHSRIDKSTIEHAAATFEQAFRSLLDDGITNLEHISLITPREIAQLREWNKEISPRIESRIHDQVYQQMLHRPDSLAVEAWDGNLTYKELDTVANNVAAHLVSLGVQTETKVPMCFGKSKWAVISQLAILKAGGCVVPLGPKQPMQRLEMVLRDINADLILVSEQYSSRFTGLLPHVLTGEILSELPQQEAPSCLATPDNTAFIIYTSGSTGIPKGVVLPHGSLCTSIHHLGARFSVGPSTRMIQFSAYTFDISIQDIYTTWHYGGCLCISRDEDLINDLGAAMRSYRVNFAGLTSTVAGFITPDDVPALKTLVLLGEAVKPAVVSRWINHVKVFNAYGPSECSIQACVNELTQKSNPLNIGFPFAASVWVVDPKDFNLLAPIGTPGELLIEGPIQAQGYLNDQIKTDSAFKVDPSWVSRYGFSSGRRFYCTGDLVRQNRDGSLLYIGRRDTQIKVRGQRVEIGEIEHHLLQHELIVDAAVICPRRGPCQDRLVGLLTIREFYLDDGQRSTIKTLPQDEILKSRHRMLIVNNYLSGCVPEHMLPTVWIPLSSKMPQNDSAKLDRKKLTQWLENIDQSFIDSLVFQDNCQEVTRPHNDPEQKILKVFANVLGIPDSQISVEGRSFINMGGDSLMAMQAVSQLRTQGITFMVREVLESKSITQLASRIQTDQGSMVTQENSLHQAFLPFETLPECVEYWGIEADQNFYADQMSRHIILDNNHSELLRDVSNDALRTEVVEILLGVLFLSYRKCFPDRPTPTVFEEYHARSTQDTENYGMIEAAQETTMLPICVNAENSESSVDVVRRTKDSRRGVLRASPGSLATESRKSPLIHKQIEILFRYCNGFPCREHVFDEQINSVTINDSRRLSVIVVEARWLENSLHVDFQFNRHMKFRNRFFDWVETYTRALHQIICELASTPPSFTTSDFPLINPTPEILSKLQRDILPEISIDPKEIEDFYPCSPIQHGILMSQIKTPSAYYIQLSVEIKSADRSTLVSIDRVARAYQTLVDRHPMLRTVFVQSLSFGSDNNLFNQLVLKSCKANIEQRLCDDQNVESCLGIHTALTPSFFENQLGHKLILYSTPSDRVFAQIIINHALVDASSLMLLQTELANNYSEDILVASRGPAYSKYVSYLQTNPIGDALNYWSGRLAKASPSYLPPLGIVKGSVPTQPTEGMALENVTIDLNTVEDLKKFGKSQGVTIANIFQVAWALVLSQYIESNDVSFGYLSSGRDVPVEGVQEMLGPLINMMVTRIILDPSLTVGQIVRQVQNDFFEGFKHQRVPLSEIWHALQLQGQSLFNTSLSYRHEFTTSQEQPSLLFEPIASEDRTEYDVTVNIWASLDKTRISLQYSPQFMPADCAIRLVRYLEQVSHLLAASPEIPIGELPITTQDDIDQIRSWNDEALTVEKQCIHEIVHQQRLRQPDRVAVCAWDGNLTYTELDDMADQLACGLLSGEDIRAESKVALCFDKSRWAIVSQLGVLKAGAVVVSLNPQHPIHRLQTILEDTKSSVMLTTHQYSQRFAGIVPHILEVDSNLFSQLEVTTTAVPFAAKPDNAAFVIYTSGSTGVPKGVVLTNASLCANFQACGKPYGLNQNTRCLQFASYTFDASISDIWGTIYHGGCVCVISDEERMNNLQDAIESYEANFVQITPTVAELLDFGKLPLVKTLILGGEPVKTGVAENLLKTAHQLTIINGYGPTECSIYTTWSAPLQDKDQAPNIGRPLVGGVWLIKNENSIAPIGSLGEIWIEGPLLSRGYLNDKQKTDQSFITDPIWARVVGLTGHRFYRTGDIARQTPTGDLIHFGRKDNQIKIRGQRVEIGEIEYNIKSCLTSVKTAVATLITLKSTGRAPIVAVVMEMNVDQVFEKQDNTNGIFILSNSSFREGFLNLRSSLLDTLPTYMVPSLFIPATNLPKTTSGKLDRKMIQQSLEALSEDQLLQYSLSSVDNAMPNTETEKLLQSIWAHVLGVNVNRIGIHEDFLQCGGDSVTAMRLVSAASLSDLPLTVSDVFKHPKLHEMAAHIDQISTHQQDEEVIPSFSLWKHAQNSTDPKRSHLQQLTGIANQCGVPISDVVDIYPCTPLQEGLMAVTIQNPNAYVGRWVFRLHENTDSGRLRLAWKQLVDIAPILRTRILLDQIFGAFQVVLRSSLDLLHAVDLDGYILLDDSNSFNYTSPLVRAAIVEVTQSQRYFVLTAHHSAYDGWSLVKLFDTLSKLYRGNHIACVPSYTLFIRYLERQDYNKAKSFWQSQLGGGLKEAFPALPHPSYRPRPSELATCSLKSIPIVDSITVASLLRAAWSLAISAYCGDDVLFGSALSGRSAAVRGILDILAPTITTVPVRICIDKSMSIRHFVSAVHKQAIDMIPFEHTGLQNIHRLVNGFIFPQHLFVVQPTNEHQNLIDGDLFSLEPRFNPAQVLEGYALTVECMTGVGTGGVIDVDLRFDANVLSSRHVGRIISRFKHIFSQIQQIFTPENTQNLDLIQDIEFISPEEVTELANWNDITPDEHKVLIQDPIYDQTLHQPDAPAICSWDGSLSRLELHHLTDRLAHHLVKLGVGPEVRVGLCFDKSKWAVVSIISILKAGGAVVPLSAHPVQRLLSVLENAKLGIVLTTSRRDMRFSEIVSHILTVDDNLLSNIPYNSEPLVKKTYPHNAAFVIYTSGSTGTPKGVVIEHASISTNLRALGTKFGVNNKTRAFQFSQLTFDASVHDIIMTLQFGGCVCIPSEEEKMNDIVGAANRLEVNYSLFPPRLLATLKPSEIPTLESIVVGGEALYPEHVDHWIRDTRVFNAYGPTECTIISTCNEVTNATYASNIGTTLNARSWVVDPEDHGNLLPIGASGELIIEGPLVAREYAGDPQKTSESFIVDPNWLFKYSFNRNGSGVARRMYKTGDLVRQNDDGSLTYIGRKDKQIQVRGHRVEIGEIESHIVEHPAVIDAAVCYPQRGPAQSRLVGIMTLHNSVTTPDSEIQLISSEKLAGAMEIASSVHQHLLQCLPEYMTPQSWLPVANIPLNSSGKVDRRKLSMWLDNMSTLQFDSIISSAFDQTDKTPKTKLEEQLQTICGEILNLSPEKLTMNRSFLSMGGDSITAMQVVSRCASRFHISLSVRDILQSRSITEVAMKSSYSTSQTDDDKISDSPFELTPIQHLYFSSMAPDGTNSTLENQFNQCLCLILTISVEFKQLEHAIGVLVEKHEMLRARFFYEKSSWKQKIEPTIHSSFYLGSSEVATPEQEEKVLALAQGRLNLTEGPVFSAMLIHRLQTNQKVLFLVAHHLVVDIVSWQIITRDLEELVRLPKPQVSRKTMSFQKWACLQNEYAQTCKSPAEVLPMQTNITDWNYWGLKSEDNLYGDRVFEETFLDEKHTSILYGEYQPLRTEPIEVLISSLFHSFKKTFPDRPVPTIFNEGHGREPWADWIDLSETVGWFTTMTPIYIDFNEDEPIEILRRTKDTRRSIPGRGLPYFSSRLLTDAGKDSFASHGLAEVMVNYTGRHQKAGGGEGPFIIDTAGIPFNLGKNVKRLAVFEIEAAELDGRLYVRFYFSKQMQNTHNISLWIKTFRHSLRNLLQDLVTLRPCYTVSDFSLLDMSPAEFLSLQADILPSLGINDMSDIVDIYPCSPIQEGILMSQFKDPSTYHVQLVCEISTAKETSVDIRRLSAAWDTVVTRHAILRTFFIQKISNHNLFFQVVRKEWHAHFRQLRCSNSDDVISAFSQIGRPSYSSSQPPHQLLLCQTDTNRCFIQIDVNHALMDASSLGIILKELTQAYDCLLPPTPAPSYGSYISFLQQAPVDESLAFWTNKLADSQPCLFPASFTRTSEAKVYKHHRADLNDVRIFHIFRDTHGVTTANLVQLAWALVLAEYTRSSDILFGYLANGRDAPISGVSSVVGPMINMIVTRVHLDKSMAVAESARCTQSDFLDAFNHQRTSLADIQHAISLSDQSLFNTTVSYKRKPVKNPEKSSNLVVSEVTAEDPTEYDLHLDIESGDDNIRISLQYATSFLDDTSASRVLGAFVGTLTSLASNCQAPLGDILVLDRSDIEQLRTLNSKVPDDIHWSVHEKFHHNQLLQPFAPAVCGYDGQMTYYDLDNMSDRLAQHIANLGIGKETMVGLCFEKSMWAIVSLLAVLKAGAVVVPLGTNVSSQRLQFIINDTNIPLVLTTAQQVGKFDELPINHALVIDAALINVLPVGSCFTSPPVLDKHSAAVVMYTSGSTGNPKGVVLTHGSVSSSVEAHGKRLDLGPNTRTLQYSAYIFDISLLDMLTTLRFGGCVCVVSEEERLDVRVLEDKMETMGVNFAVLTPTVATLVNPENVQSMRKLVLAGEKVEEAVVKAWSPHVSVFNGYGPAECTILSTVQGPITDPSRASNIGTATTGALWVVDQHDYHSLVPIGAVGELLIEGPLLAREYLNDSERTESSFIYEPAFLSKYNLGSPTHQRMYRTGDLVRQDPVDGSIIYIGRADGQVKIHGQRVELGEIEFLTRKNFAQARMAAATLFKPQTRQSNYILAVAMEIQLQAEARQLATSGSPFFPVSDFLLQSFLELKKGLSQTLPPYMVPTLYVPMQNLPFTASGKLDRKLLQAQLECFDEEQFAHYSLSEASGNNPLTETENQLCNLWATVLATPGPISSSAHFFRLGGDSVTAMRLVALAHSVNPLMSLHVADIFKNPILSDMAQLIENRYTETDPSYSVMSMDNSSSAGVFMRLEPECLASIASEYEVNVDSIEAIYPCTSLQEGLIAITQHRSSAYIGRWVFRVGESIDIQRFRDVWQIVIHNVPILRTRIIHNSAIGSVQMVLRDEMNWVDSSSELETYLAQDIAKPITFGTPLIRLALVKCRSENFFVMTAHHSVYDGWTLRKVFETVLQLYNGQSITRLIPFSNFVGYLQRTTFTPDAKDYWKTQMQGDLGAEFPYVPKHYEPGPTKVMSHQLINSKQINNITAATLLRATWALLLSHETKSTNVTFPTTLSGRTAHLPGILDIAGPTITTVPIHILIDKTQSLSEYLMMVQQQGADMIPFEQTGLKNISEMTGVSFYFRHLFVVQPSEEQLDQAFPGLHLQPTEISNFMTYPLVFMCTISPKTQDAIKLEVHFDRALVSESKIDSLLNRFKHLFLQFQTIMDDGTNDPPLGDIGFLTASDINQIREWNKPGQILKKTNACIHEVVYQQFLSQPEASALCAWDGNLTYSQLNQFASRLAHHLVDLGVGPEVAVALMFKKSQWAVVSELAILKAGGAIVPINHQHPLHRVSTILDQVQAKVILTSDENRSFGVSVPHTLTINQDLLNKLPDKTSPACETVTPDNSAFVIFTSGSTGTPKGVVLDHGALVTSIQAHGLFYYGPNTRTLNFATYTFDASISEVFGTLMFGGCVCVISEEDRANNLAQAMHDANVNFAMLTPTVANLLNPRDVPALDKLAFIGEAVRTDVVLPWMDSQTELYNAYGPTECSIITTTRHITNTTGLANIGHALDNSRQWVVNPSDHNQLVPIGTTGELLIEGPSLARCYLSDEKKTAQAFLKDLLWRHISESQSEPERRFYSTGDLVEQQPDGSFLYVGRKDNQVKINGQRVEIGEVEHWVKKRQPEIHEVIAGFPPLNISPENGYNEKVLTVVMQSNVAESLSTSHSQESTTLLPVSNTLRQSFARLRSELSDVLPGYMVPQAYIPVTGFPVSDSGKLDRKTMWAIVKESDNLSQYLLTSTSKVSPTTATELQLQELWAAALNVPTKSIGKDDDFLSLGGDSISAMRLVAKARETDGLSFSVADVFHSPVLADLAVFIDAQNKNKGSSISETYKRFSNLHRFEWVNSARESIGQLLSITAEILDAAPTTEFQEYCVLSSLRESRDLLAYISIDGDGLPDVNRWKASCLELIERHEILRTAYVAHQTHMLQVVLNEYRPDIAVYETGQMPIEQFTKQLIAEDMYRKPQLGRPFVEFSILTSSNLSKHRIIFRLSHAEYDGISISYFMETLRAIYNNKQPVADYAPFSRYISHLNTRNMDDSREYWRALLQGSSMPKFSTSTNNTPQRQAPSRLIHCATRRVETHQPLPTGISMSTVIRASWALVVARHVHSADVLFGEVVTGRNTGDPVAERASGCCVNVVPVRTLFHDTWTIIDLFNYIQKQQFSRIPHETLGYREMLNFCGGTPAPGYYTSRINHVAQTLPQTLEIGSCNYHLSIELPESAQDSCDISITSSPKPGGVEIAVGYLDGVVSPELVDTLTENLCTTVNRFLDGDHHTQLTAAFPDDVDKLFG